ncbi:hypothetical protein ACFY12_13105 [Streptomyces sp. NPDC001339]|uniref:hypothetical protein n=1 Tax=Streptomyces sp. NPDC001339 TaxID=3364563 RepID=UPI0036A1FB4B
MYVMLSDLHEAQDGGVATAVTMLPNRPAAEVPREPQALAEQPVAGADLPAPACAVPTASAGSFHSAFLSPFPRSEYDPPLSAALLLP